MPMLTWTRSRPALPLKHGRRSRHISLLFFLIKTHSLSNKQERQRPLPHRQKLLHQQPLLALYLPYCQSPLLSQSERNSLKKLQRGMTGSPNREGRSEKCVGIISAPPTCGSPRLILMPPRRG